MSIIKGLFVALKNLSRNAPTIYTSGINKKDAGWTQDLGDGRGQQDLTWLI